MQAINMKRKNLALHLVLGLLFVLLFCVLYSIFYSPSTKAADAHKFKAGYIISDSIFTNYNSMSVSKIQSFLNSKVPSCDTNGTKPASEFGRPDLTHAQYAAMRGWNAPPYICLKNYSQGGKSAAQIIYDKAQKYKINPQVLIVLLQKEQSLVTDTWPLNIQYRSATGYACPDTAPCDSQYYGFTNQVDWAAKMFRAILNDSPTWYTPYELGNEYIYYSPNLSCGGSTVNIQNRATQALYNYTPYQPNTVSLNAGYGDAAGDCDSHGNRNFFLYFTDWFGSTTASYDAGVISTTYYSNSLMTNVIDLESTPVSPGQTIYGRVLAKNNGSKAWEQSFTRLATIENRNRINSAFYTNDWLSESRPTSMEEGTVSPTGNGTFDFSITAPQDVGEFTEYFGLVADGRSWMDSEPIVISLTVEPSANYDGRILDTSFYLDSARKVKLSENDVKVSKDRPLYVTTTFKNTGRLNLTSPNTRLATVDPKNRTSQLYDNTWLSTNRPTALNEGTIATGEIGSFNYTVRGTSSSGVVEESFGVVLEGTSWIDNATTPLTIKVLDHGVDLLTGAGFIEKDQSIFSESLRLRLILQSNSDLVLYDTSKSPWKAVWHAKTGGSGASRLVMQNDGNLVLYNTNVSPWKAVWHTRSSGSKASRLVMQNDGNLVLYNINVSPWKAVWHTRSWVK